SPSSRPPIRSASRAPSSTGSSPSTARSAAKALPCRPVRRPARALLARERLVVRLAVEPRLVLVELGLPVDERVRLVADERLVLADLLQDGLHLVDACRVGVQVPPPVRDGQVERVRHVL